MTDINNDFKAMQKNNTNFIHIDLDPKQNIKNKKYFKNLLNKIAETSLENLDELLSNFYHNEAELYAFYPINEIKGIDEIKNKLWVPLKKSFPDLERRNNLVIGGSFQDKVFVSFISHLTGTFVSQWLGVPPTNKTIYLRTCEAHQITNNKIIKSYILIDTIDFIRQAGHWPINKSLGVEGMWPSPITGDGENNENLDKDLSLKSLHLDLMMQKSLDIKPEKEPGLKRDQIREKLMNHPQKKYWHPKMMWYGPSGIGTARGLSGFVDHHQLPFRLTFRERDYNTIGHFIRIGDGNFSMTGGWHSIKSKYGTNDWLGFEAKDKMVEMRVMDFYLNHEGLIRENWVPIDIAHILNQIGIDIFKLIHTK